MNLQLRQFLLCLSLASLLNAAAGCTSLSTSHTLDPVPAQRLPEKLLGRSRSQMREVSLGRLRRRPMPEYRLAAKDVLGIYIETILGQPDEAPPVHFPEDASREPAIGFPIPIREDGTIALPLIPAIHAAGLTLTELQGVIEQAYTVDRRVLPRGRNRIIVTLIKRHAERVLVVREEAGISSHIGHHENAVKRGAGYVVDLPAGENDLLHALNQTGGLPGLDAQNEVLIIRSTEMDAVEYDRLVAALTQCQEPYSCPPPIPDAPGVTRIPLRHYPDNVPTFTEADITLRSGDIVLIQSRDREKYYTGGVLGGGEFPIPRDYDLDVLQAVAIARGQVGGSGAVLSQVAQSGYGVRGGGPLPPTNAIIVRKLCDGGQIPIKVDLKKALSDSRQRILVQPEDLLIVKYKPHEEILNTLLSLIQVNFLFNGLSGNGF